MRHKIVHIAEGQHEIRTAGGRDLVTVGPEFGDFDFTVVRGVGGELRLEAGVLLSRFLRSGVLLAVRRDISALRLQIGRQNFRPIAAGAGQDFDDDAMGRHAKERKRLGGMAIGVARAVLLRALGSVDQGFQGGIDGLTRRRDGEEERRECNVGEAKIRAHRRRLGAMGEDGSSVTSRDRRVHPRRSGERILAALDVPWWTGQTTRYAGFTTAGRSARIWVSAMPLSLIERNVTRATAR